MPQLTVLMPFHGRADWLRGAVQSTLNAMPRDSELLVCDDASPERAETALIDIKDKRLRIMSSQTKLGVAATLNAGLAGSDSALVGRMDADDICLRHRFRVQLSQMKAGGLDAVFGAALFVDHNTRPLVRQGIPNGLSGPAVYVNLLLGNNLLHPTVLASRHFYADMGGYSENPSEDFELWLRSIIERRHMRRSSMPVLAYRVHPSQATQSLYGRVKHLTEQYVVASQSMGISVSEPLATHLLARTPIGADLPAELSCWSESIDGLISQHRPLTRRFLRLRLGQLLQSVVPKAEFVG
jgi:hypothetical protein